MKTCIKQPHPLSFTFFAPFTPFENVLNPTLMLIFRFLKIHLSFKHVMLKCETDLVHHVRKYEQFMGQNSYVCFVRRMSCQNFKEKVIHVMLFGTSWGI